MSADEIFADLEREAALLLQRSIDELERAYEEAERRHALSRAPLLAPPTDLELRDMERRDRDRREGRVRQKAEDRFPVNPHD